MAITHPTIRSLEEKLLKEQEQNELLLEYVSARIPLPPLKKKYKVVNQRIKEIVSEYGTWRERLVILTPYCA